MKIKQSTADMGLLLVGILWGLGFIFVKIGLNEGIDPIYLLSLRFTTGTIFLYLIFRKQLKNLSIRDLRSVGIIGFFNVLGYFLQTYGAMWTTAGKNAFFTGINVVMVPYLYWIIHKKIPSILAFFASLICIVGIGIMSIDGNFKLTELNFGDILTILSAFFFAGQIVLVGYFSEKIKMSTIAVMQMLIGSMVFNTMLLIKSFSGVRVISGMALISILYIIIFSTIVPAILQPLCQRVTTSTRASILLSTESIFAPFFAYFILGETLSTKTIIGASFIFLAVLISEIKIDTRKE